MFIPVVCGLPPNVDHATHDAPTDQMQFPAGTQLTYTCEFGYYREGIPRAVCSGAEGQWIGPKMSCKGRSHDGIERPLHFCLTLLRDRAKLQSRMSKSQRMLIEGGPLHLYQGGL